MVRCFDPRRWKTSATVTAPTWLLAGPQALKLRLSWALPNHGAPSAIPFILSAGSRLWGPCHPRLAQTRW